MVLDAKTIENCKSVALRLLHCSRVLTMSSMSEQCVVYNVQAIRTSRGFAQNSAVRRENRNVHLPHHDAGKDAAMLACCKGVGKWLKELRRFFFTRARREMNKYALT